MKIIPVKVKVLFQKLKNAVDLVLKLNMANSYIDLLEKDITDLRASNDKLRVHEYELESSLELEKSKNAIARDRAARMNELLHQLRERLHEHGATDAERHFVQVAVQIHEAGKVMKGRSFKRHLRAIQYQRELVDPRRRSESDVSKMDRQPG